MKGGVYRMLTQGCRHHGGFPGGTTRTLYRHFGGIRGDTRHMGKGDEGATGLLHRPQAGHLHP